MREVNGLFEVHGLKKTLDYCKILINELMRFTLKNINEDQLKNQAQNLAGSVVGPCCIALSGELGVGKSTFARSFIHTLVPKIEVPSPTFTLIQTYNTPKGDVWHCDLYRLKYPEEVEELGLLEAFNQNICIVEWPNRLGSLLPIKGYKITLSMGDSPLSRHFDCEENL